MMTATHSTMRPANCRNRLRDEGKPYPRSGCAVCRDGGLRGCPYERNGTETKEAHLEPDIVKRLHDHAKAQDKMAAGCKEDMRHWHHVAVACLIREAAAEIERLRNK